ncbi:ABC transporter substrate-binding protein [Paenirhodobacter sp.]|uniref:ABC transporter substrate-binding protein n=1 Tax=Paenirhodobacter sp. TaxID=1965326 RepID=UPI003B419F39
MKTLALACAVLAAPAFAEDVTFLIDWLPSGDKAAVYYGVEKGYFKDAGLDVTIQSGRGSSDVVTKLATGAADIGTGGLSALLQARAESGAPVTAIAAIYTVQPDAIFTTEGSGITRLKDLEGKTVATATFSASNVVWPILLKENGIDADSIRLLKVDPGALAPMLATGQIAATINWLTVAPAFEGPLAEVGKVLHNIPWSDAGFEGYGLSLLASDRMIQSKPETLRKFVAAYEKAQAAAIADPAGAAAAVQSLAPGIDLAAAEGQWRASIPLMVNPTAEKDGAGVFEPGLLRATWDWVARSQGLAPDSFDPATAVDTRFLK